MPSEYGKRPHENQDPNRAVNGHLKSKLRYQLVPFNEIGLNNEIQYLIKGIIPKQGIVCLYGAPKEGKSFLVLDIAMHIALGWEYRGQKVEQGTVIYCAFEGQAGFANRILAFRQSYLSDYEEVIPFYLLPIRMNLIEERKAFIEDIRAQGVVPSFVVLDTLNRSIPNGNEDGLEFTQYIRAADAISDAFGCTVLIVHHILHSKSISPACHLRGQLCSS